MLAKEDPLTESLKEQAFLGTSKIGRKTQRLEPASCQQPRIEQYIMPPLLDDLLCAALAPTAKIPTPETPARLISIFITYEHPTKQAAKVDRNCFKGEETGHVSEMRDVHKATLIPVPPRLALRVEESAGADGFGSWDTTFRCRWSCARGNQPERPPGTRLARAAPCGRRHGFTGSDSVPLGNFEPLPPQGNGTAPSRGHPLKHGRDGRETRSA
ncbi:hypothetical protein C8F04DRAFT_1202059 [Mycena alexandri]|uniref:Uncharacterized protein n=1 Tax=Mycena alexandri TaxID=1745969 RepID=A0AAD6RWG7_9AGAR|nr:hypothetical protein C8F04DRAFT_1202059 [Mycena alexandri]